MRRRRLKRGALALIILFGLVLTWNLVSLQRHVWDALGSDPRNRGISVWMYHRLGVIPGEVVYDLRAVEGDRSPMDVIRLMLQVAERLKDREYARVVLAWRGDHRFAMEGRYFQTLGQEYGVQNPMYTIRTMPENLYRPDGRPAFGSWTGGLLGVLTKQMEDFNRFHREWYID